MSIIASKPETQYTPCPEGLHQAVCCDVIDLGSVAGTWGDKHKVRLVWQIDEMNQETSRPFDVRKQYSLSLHDRATLRKDLESWRGRKFTADELKGFDLEKLLGVNCQVQVVQDISEEGTTWANVQAIVPAPRSAVKLVPREYVRMQDRHDIAIGTSGGDADDPIPFMWLMPFIVPATLTAMSVLC